MSRPKFLVADLLCGAGGTSTGAQEACEELGLEMELVCVNHSPPAIASHQANHPRARHYVQDIATVRPHLVVPEGYLDLLAASPTCTHHSIARGGKPTSDQQRSDPWHIITWLTELRVKRIIIENVWEFRKWGPVDPATGKPIKEREGEYFNAWIDVIRALNFDPEWRRLNAADYGDATTRQRFILMARSDGRRVCWPVASHAKNPKPGDGLQSWRGAREIINWNIKGRSIFGRKKPLAAKTLQRIYAGILNNDWPQPYVVVLRRHMDAQGIEIPLPALCTGGHVGVAEPILLSQHSSGAARSVVKPLPTLTTGGASAAIHPGCARPMLVEPFIVNGRRNAKPLAVSDNPIPALDTKGGVWLAEPFMLSQASGGAARVVGEPVPTIPGGGAHALISPYYSNGGQRLEACHLVDDPLGAITSKDRCALIVGVTNSRGGPRPRGGHEPVPTLTTAKGGEFALVTPITHHDGSDRTRDTAEPLPTVTGAHRGDLAFITAQHGERAGQPPRVHSIDDPAPTIAATGHVDLVVGGEHYDILFRMLEPPELAGAMGFKPGYKFLGTKTQQVNQIGNAVSVAKMKACVMALAADAAPPQRAGQDVLVAAE